MIDSPVSLVLKELIQFDKTSATSVYIQIAQQIINAIQRGYLKEGTALPGTIDTKKASSGTCRYSRVGIPL